MSAKEAIDLVKNGDTLGVTGAGMRGTPEFLLKTLEDKYLETQTPKDLTLFSVVGHGAFDHRGDSRLAHKGLLKKAIVSHPDTNPELRDAIQNNEMLAYIFPQGVSSQLLRSISVGQPGYITKIGLGTYLDPRVEGAKGNDITKEKGEDMIESIIIDNEEYLMYKSFPINVAFIRCTTADLRGNISMEHECNRLEFFELANAVKSCGGTVIVQVKRLVENGTIHPHRVVIPHVLVDAVVVCDDWENYHMMNDNVKFNEAFCGNLRVPLKNVSTGFSAGKPGAQTVITRRGCMELFPGAVINLGWGIAAGIGAIAEEEDIIDTLTMTVELGVFGGVPGKFPNFGAVVNADAVIPMANMFDFYDGGGLDVACLGGAQVDADGSINASKFGTRVSGPGGFVDISTSSPKVVICMQFMGKAEVEVVDGKVKVVKEGTIKKFVNKIDQITFNGKYAGDKDITYVTERGVFKLINGKVTLVEIAPGIDLEKDILAQMEWTPEISKDLKVMDARIFQEGPMNYFK